MLTVDGKVLSQQKMEHTIPFLMSLDESLDIGIDTRTPIDDSYKFTGTINKVTYHIGPEQLTAAEQDGQRAPSLDSFATQSATFLGWPSTPPGICPYRPEHQPAYGTRTLAAVAICLYRQCPSTLLDRTCSEGHYLGSHGNMERQFHCHARCSLSFAFPANIRRQASSIRAGSRSEGTGCATIKSRQVALT